MCKVILPNSTVCDKSNNDQREAGSQPGEIRSIGQQNDKPVTNSQVYVGTIESVGTVLLFNITESVGTVSWFDL